jgi:hypothetical protein
MQVVPQAGRLGIVTTPVSRKHVTSKSASAADVTSPSSLTSDEARRKLEKFGPNAFSSRQAERRRRPSRRTPIRRQAQARTSCFSARIARYVGASCHCPC